MYATPTLITEVHNLVARVQLLLVIVIVYLTPYTALANSYWISVYDKYQCQGQAINDNDYSCHITAVQLVYPIVLGPYHATS